MIYGVLGALPDEVKHLCADMSDCSSRRVADVDFITGDYQGKKVTVCCAGMGKVNAAAATQILISVFGADRILFSGIAGNLCPELDIGDVVLGEEVVHHDIDNLTYENTGLKAEIYKADSVLLRASQKACSSLGVHALSGRIATGEKFICDKESKQDITVRWNPMCVEMEGAAVAQVAKKNNVPFLIVRTMSDNADEAALDKLIIKHFDISDYCRTAASIIEETLRAL